MGPLHPPTVEQMFILSKGGSISPSCWLPLQNLKTGLGKEEDVANSTWGDAVGSLLMGLRQRFEWSDLVINCAGKEDTEVARRVPEGRQSIIEMIRETQRTVAWFLAEEGSFHPR